MAISQREIVIARKKSLPLEVLPVGETSRSDRGGAVSGEEKVSPKATDEVKAFLPYPVYCLIGKVSTSSDQFA